MGSKTRSPRRRPCGTCGDSGWILLVGGSGFGAEPCPMGCKPVPLVDPADLVPIEWKVSAPAVPAYACPFPGCGAVSHHPDDVANEFCGACHRRAGDLLGLFCPACRQPAVFRILGQQAFCGNDECTCLYWDPDCDASQFANSATIDLTSGDRSEKSSG